MPKIKKMLNTKHQSKYLGPYTVTRMTESHVIIPDRKAGAGSLNKEKKLPIDIVRPYYKQDLGHGGATRKIKSETTSDSPSKKLRQVNTKYF